MPPEALQLGLFVIEEAIKITPGLITELQSLFSKPNPTANDWAGLRARILAKSYEDYDPLPITAQPGTVLKPEPVPIKVITSLVPAAAVATAQIPAALAPPAGPENVIPLVQPASPPAKLPIHESFTE